MNLPTDQELHEALRRIAMTPDGFLLRRYLQLVLNEVPTITAGDSWPLLVAHGRRQLARDLVSIMDQRLAESAALDRSGDPSEPVIRSVSKPVASVDPLRRRVGPYAGTSGKA